MWSPERVSCWYEGHGGLMRPTQEQMDALAKFATGASLKISACAGSGKTTTLRHLANSTQRRGVYIAFNSEIAKEAGSSFPKHVECRTAHSLAYRAVGRGYRARLKGRLTPKVLISAMGLGREQSGVSTYAIMEVLLSGLFRFCHSDASTPHLGHLGLFDPESALGGFLLRHGEGWMRRLWERLLSKEETCPLTHDFYLKHWALSRPTCPAEYVLFDEAQDANAVLLGLLKLWEYRDGAQIVFVGDPFQQIYSWRGAVNALERVRTAQETELTQSFRYGSQIASLARVVLQELRGAKTAIQGTDVLDQVIVRESERGESQPDAILTRTNACAIACVVDLVEQGVGVRIAGGTRELRSLIRGVQALREGKRAYRCPELAGFEDWEEVVSASEQEHGSDLRILVHLVASYDLEVLLDILSKLPRHASVTVSTAHRAKGLEFDHVRLTGDFLVPEKNEEDEVVVAPEEAHLLYVAVTRARVVVDVASCPLALYALGESPESSHALERAKPTQVMVFSRAHVTRLHDVARERGITPDEALEYLLSLT